MSPELTIGELRHTSAGNIFELVSYDGRNAVHVRRVAVIGGPHAPPLELWDHDLTYRWTFCQWESLPLVGEKSDDPSFGLFCPLTGSR